MILRAKLDNTVVAAIENLHDGLFYLHWDPPPSSPPGKIASSNNLAPLFHMVERVYPGVRWLDASRN